MALSPVLSTLYLSPLFHIFEKWIKNLNILVFIFFFVDDGLFITQKNIVVSNLNLFCSYHIMTFILEKFSLIVEHGKTKVFHFSRLHTMFNPLLLNLSTLGGPILWPKNSWKYLGFSFDRKLIFQQYVFMPTKHY